MAKTMKKSEKTSNKAHHTETEKHSREKTPKEHHAPKATKHHKTCVTANCDIGFNNELYLRGNGGGLSWDKGVKMTNIKADEWQWESTSSFSDCECKVLINDKCYEEGENHPLCCGKKIHLTPKFA